MQEEHMQDTKKIAKILHQAMLKIVDIDAKMVKMKGDKIHDKKFLVEILKEIRDQKVLLGGLTATQMSIDFGATYPAGKVAPKSKELCVANKPPSRTF